MLTALRRARRNLPLGLRADAVELLDGGGLSLPEVERNLADLARLNRLPGGAERASRASDGSSTGGRMPASSTRAPGAPTCRSPSRAIAGGRPRSMPIRTCCSSRAARLRPRRWSRSWRATHPTLPFEDDASTSATARSWSTTFPRPRSSPPRELGRVARHGVVINDLRRGMLPLLATAATVVALGGSRVTRNDGLVSARRAYTLDELDDLIGEASPSPAAGADRWLPRT